MKGRYERREGARGEDVHSRLRFERNWLYSLGEEEQEGNVLWQDD